MDVDEDQSVILRAATPETPERWGVAKVYARNARVSINKIHVKMQIR